ncbi:hypothetical protein MBLNU457_g0031t2 [Dothideomycetes sp. NU457]
MAPSVLNTADDVVKPDRSPPSSSNPAAPPPVPPKDTTVPAPVPSRAATVPPPVPPRRGTLQPPVPPKDKTAPSPDLPNDMAASPSQPSDSTLQYTSPTNITSADPAVLSPPPEGTEPRYEAPAQNASTPPDPSIESQARRYSSLTPSSNASLMEEDDRRFELLTDGQISAPSPDSSNRGSPPTDTDNRKSRINTANRNPSSATTAASASDPRQDSFWRNPFRKLSRSKTDVSRRGTLASTLGEQASPSDIDRAQQASQDRPASASNLDGDPTPNQGPSHHEPVEGAEDAQDNTQPPPPAPENQQARDKGLTTTQISPRVMSPTQPETPASNRAIHGRDETETPASNRAGRGRDHDGIPDFLGPPGHPDGLPIGPGGGRMPARAERFANFSRYPFPPNPRIPHVRSLSPIDLAMAERQYVARAYRFLCQEIEVNMTTVRGHKLERINQVNNNINQDRPNMDDVDLDMNHGWDGTHLGSRRLGEKRHIEEYKKNNKWVNEDWARGPHARFQIPIPPYTAWNLLQRSDYGGLEDGNFGSGEWRNE